MIARRTTTVPWRNRQPCACDDQPDDVYWRIDGDGQAYCHERGWTCSRCERPVVGDPNGFSPALDRAELAEKVSAVLLWIHDYGLVYVSNATEGAELTGLVTQKCRDAAVYDQLSISGFLIGEIARNGRHAQFWQAVATGVLCGADPRRRCAACKRLARVTSFHRGQELVVCDCGLEAPPWKQSEHPGAPLP